MAAKRGDQILQNLVRLGLSEKEASVYLALLRGGALTASQVAGEIDGLPNAVYRLAHGLEEKGFVVDLGGHPKRFQARPPEAAFERFLERKELEVEEVKARVLSALGGEERAAPTRARLVTGREGVFQVAMEMYKRAEEEILLISIGEPIPEEFVLVMRDTLERGVNMKMIAHKYDEENKDLLSAWSRMGMEVRHYPDWGFHLLNCDGEEVLLAANNPEDTRQRTGIVLTSQALAKAMRDYFFSVWEKAEEISPS